MILKGLKRRSNQIFFKKNYDSFIENSSKRAPEQLNRILVISDDVADLDEVKSSLKSVFKVEESQITSAVFTEKKDKNGEEDFLIHPSDFGWYGKVEEGYLKDVLTNRFDLLINHSKIENLYTDLLVLQVKAGLKVGLGSLNNENYDLLIQCETSDIALFTSELKKYLEILK